MDLKVVKEFIDLAKEEGVASLTYEKDDFKLSVDFVGGQVAAPVQFSASAVGGAGAPIGPAASSSEQVASDLIEVKSPFVGTFYRSSAPGEASFVKEGDRVSPGKTLCILEAMKIMNEIDAEISGEIVEVCVENESLVEFGQVLFRIRK